MNTTTVRVLTVSDLHQRRKLYEQLESAVAAHQPDVVGLVGDFLDMAGTKDGLLSISSCSKRLNALPVGKIVAVRGNHEDVNWLQFPRGRIHCLNGEVFTFGPLIIVGFPCLLGDESWYLDGAEGLPADASLWLRSIVAQHGRAARTLWLAHEPPNNTVLTEKTGPLSGNSEWREAIELFSPLLIISGHDHDTPARRQRWRDVIGSSVCINPGQARDVLEYVVIDMTFAATTPSLPRHTKVSCYPAGDTFAIAG